MFPPCCPLLLRCAFSTPASPPAGPSPAPAASVRASRLQEPADTLPSGRKAPRRGGRAVECGGLENRFGPLGPTRVQIPPPPPLIFMIGSERSPPLGRLSQRRAEVLGHIGSVGL